MIEAYLLECLREVKDPLLDLMVMVVACHLRPTLLP